MTEMVERLGERIESLGSRDEMLEALINAIQDDEKVFGEGFFKYVISYLLAQLGLVHFVSVFE